MSERLLQTCRDYFTRSYRERLGHELKQVLDGAGPDPAWRTVSTSDFTSAPTAEADAAGLLLDPEVGVLLYLIPFVEDTRVSVHVNCALRIRSRLSVERNYSAEPPRGRDPAGAWRVALLWLVPEANKSDWMEQVIKLRRGTMFSEEVSLDAVFYVAGAESAAIEAHGFPCLLLSTRQILRKDGIGDVTQWMRADAAVRAALCNFADSFETEAKKVLASEVLAQMDRNSEPAAPVPMPPAPPGELRSLRVLNFRNLSEVDIDFGSDPVSSSVIHGPNGTGKSSVCEALSIALFSSSYRYNRFADHENERDLPTASRSASYVKEYLTNMDAGNSAPRLGLNGADPAGVRLVSPDRLFEAELAMSGTVLTQDTSLEFARMQADQLSARVLRNYSELAERLESFAEERYQRAHGARQDYLRKLGLMANITVLNTAYIRLATRELGQLVPSSVDSHSGWLHRLETLRTNSASPGLAARWREWDDSRSTLAGTLAADRSVEATNRGLQTWLETYNGLAARSAEVVRAVTANKQENASVLADAEGKLRILVDWRAKRAQVPAPAISLEGEALRIRLTDLQKSHQRIITSGTDARGRLAHLEQVESFAAQSWVNLHPDECPSCGADHAEHGGILTVIRNLKDAATADRDRLREDLVAVKAEIDDIQRKLSAAGQAQSPLSNEEVGTLSGGLQWLLPEGVTLEACLEDERRREDLFGLLECVRSIPPVPESVDATAKGIRAAQALVDKYLEAESIFEAPDNWKSVSAVLTDILARVLREHLPGTLAGLWVELAMNLTAAAWLLPERPKIDVATQRNERKSTLRLKGRLVRYILNQSEIHVLGLAWFFTRYLTHGRFQHSCLILDDPAQEMDQTTYREFCRLLETFCRLHRKYGRPLKLVLLMNQENRALDAARATAGVTHLLGWVPEQKNTISTLNMVTPGFFAPLPTVLFEDAATA